MIDGLLLEPAYLWLIAAAIFLALEAMGISGVGLVFGGLAAFLVGALIETDIVGSDHYAMQFGLWFAVTVVLAFLLFKPLKKWRTDPASKDSFDNIVGTTAKVAVGGLMIGRPGKVHWSGSMMNAQIDEHSPVEAFLEGDMVMVTAVRGNQLMVAPLPKRSQPQDETLALLQEKTLKS